VFYFNIIQLIYDCSGTDGQKILLSVIAVDGPSTAENDAKKNLQVSTTICK